MSSRRSSKIQKPPGCTCSCHDTLSVIEGSAPKPSKMRSTRDYLDDRIASLEGQLRALKTARNRHTMISYIPSEILAKILADAVWPSNEEFAAVSWKRHTRLTSVCTLWRDVALEFPSFWRCIPINASRHMGKMLARSKQAPLSIRVLDGDARFPYEAPDEETLAIVLQPTRLAQLHLCGPPSLHDRFLQRLPPDLPLLQSLYLFTMAGRTALPLCLLSAPLPSLQHLRLHSCTIPSEALEKSGLPLFSELLTLELQYISPAVPHYFILSLLSSSIKLRTLTIGDSLQGHLPFRHDDQPTIPLPRLKICSVSDSSSTVPPLLSHLAIPDSAQLSMGIVDFDTAAEEPFEIFGRLFNICGVNGARPRAFTSLRFTPYDFGATELCFSEAAEHGLEPLSTEYGLRLFITDGIDPIELLSESQLLLLPELKRFYLLWPEDEDYPTEDSVQLSERDWRNFFQRHSKIQEIHIIGSKGLDPVLRSMGPEDTVITLDTIFAGQTQPTSTTETGTSATKLPLPSLRRIHFEDAYLGLSPDEPPIMATLAATYTARIEQGYPALRITLSNCTGGGREQDIQRTLENFARHQLGIAPGTALTVDSTSDLGNSLEYDMDEEGDSG